MIKKICIIGLFYLCFLFTSIALHSCRGSREVQICDIRLNHFVSTDSNNAIIYSLNLYDDIDTAINNFAFNIATISSPINSSCKRNSLFINSAYAFKYCDKLIDDIDLNSLNIKLNRDIMYNAIVIRSC